MIFAAAARLCSFALISMAFTFENVAALVSVWFRRLSIAAIDVRLPRSEMEAMHTMHKVSRMRKLTDTNAVTICCLMVYFLRFKVKQHIRCLGRTLASPPRPLRRMLCCMASSVSYFRFSVLKMNVSRSGVGIECACSSALRRRSGLPVYPLLSLSLLLIVVVVNELLLIIYYYLYPSSLIFNDNQC